MVRLIGISLSTDYDVLAGRVLERLRGNGVDRKALYMVYIVDNTVGFANQFRALSGIFLLSLVSGRRLRSIRRSIRW